MEIVIPLSVKVSIAEDNVNINDIAKAVKQVTEDIGKHLLKQTLKECEKEVVDAFCSGAMTVAHRRKGRRGRDCQGRKGWIRKGETRRQRSFTTLVGEVRLKLVEVKC